MIPEQIFAETLRHFLSPVCPYLDDPTVTEIMINGHERIYVERGGKLERVTAKFPSEEALLTALRNIAQYAGKQVDELHAILEGRLPDGSRVQAVIPPAAFGASIVAIRRFSQTSFTLDELVARDALTQDAAAFLQGLVVAKLNVMVAGGTGSGKTSLLNTLSRCIPGDQRIIVIEDSKELRLEQEHVAYLQARAPDDKGRGSVSIRDLFRATLRLRPDRIVIGEIRGGEALDIVQAMVSGHGGCMGTLHATYPRDTMTRLETMALMSDIDMPLSAIRMQIASGVEVIVQVSRSSDGSRKVTHVTEVLGFDAATMTYRLADLFVREFRGRDRRGDLTTELVPTGHLPSCVDRLREHGCDLPGAMRARAERLAPSAPSPRTQR